MMLWGRPLHKGGHNQLHNTCLHAAPFNFVMFRGKGHGHRVFSVCINTREIPAGGLT